MVDLAEKEKWKDWKCKEPESCFECPFNDCIKDVRVDCKNTGDTLIVTFPNGNDSDIVAYYKQDEIWKLAKKLNTTEKDVLTVADGDGWWHERVFLVWGRTQEENSRIMMANRKAAKSKCSELMMYWEDGRTKKFDNVKAVADYLGVAPETVKYRLYRGITVKNAIVQKASDPPPASDRFDRRKWDKCIAAETLPVPKYEIIDPLKYVVIFCDGSTNEYYTLSGVYAHIKRFLDYGYQTFLKHYRKGEPIKCIRQITTKGKNKVNITSRGTVIGIWPTGEKIHFMSAFDASRALHVAEHTIWKYIAMEQPYRGVIFKDGGILL